MKEPISEGATLGKYRILGTLGRGSMGVVYKAEDPAIGRIVAIKTLRKVGRSKFQNAEAALERFRTEARSAGNLRHPNIITVFDASINDDIPFIVMDYVEGQSLESLIHAAGRIPPKRAIPMLNQLAEALDEANGKGVIHRDIKPSNIVVDAQDRPYILDFGVAKLNETIQEEMVDQPQEPIMGTPAYMAPEQILNRTIGPSSDLFSFALLCYEVLSGSRAFPGDTFNEVVNSILHSSPIPITSIVPEFPLQLEVEFEHALAKRPEDRPSSAHELVQILANALEAMVGTTRPPASGRRSRKPSEWKSLDPQVAGAIRADEEREQQQPLTDGSSRRDLVPFDDSRAIRGRPDSVFSGKGVGSSQVFWQGGHENVELSQRVGFRRELSLVRAFLILLGTGAFLVAGGIMYSIIKGEDPLVFFGLQDKTARIEVSAPVERSRTDILTDRHTTIDLQHLSTKLTAEVYAAELAALTNSQLVAVSLAEQTSLKRKLDALQELRTRGIPEIVPVAEKLLSHESYVVRIEAAKNLGESKNRQAAAILVEHMDDYDPLVRTEVARAIGALGSQQSVGYLKRTFQEEENAGVRKAIKAAIEKITGLPFRG